MLRVVSAFYLTLLVVLPTVGSASQPKQISQFQPDLCRNPVGRVLASSNPNLLGKGLCQGQPLELPTRTRILCFATGAVQVLSDSSWQSLQSCQSALSAASNSLRRCPLGGSGLCVNPKGPTNYNDLQLNIYGSVLITAPATLDWTGNSSAYLVQISGDDLRWQARTTKPSLSVPQLKPGVAYEITIAAYITGEVVKVKKAVINILPTQDATAIEQTLAEIQGLPILSNEKTSDMVSVYLAHGLVNDAISLLTSQTKAGMKNSRIHRMLGDLYVTAGRIDLAIPQYQEAIALATDEESLTLARLSLQELKKDL